MKKIVIAPLVLAVSVLTGCINGEDVEPITEPEETVVVAEPESAPILCENGVEYDEETAGYRVLVEPAKTTETARVYTVEDLGITFELPNTYDYTNVFQSTEELGNNSLEFNNTIEPGCTSYGDMIAPEIMVISEDQLTQTSSDIIKGNEEDFGNFTATQYSEEYLGSNMLVWYEFELGNQYYGALYVECGTNCVDPFMEIQGELMQEVLKSLSKL